MMLAKLIELADAHQKADEYVKGCYEWNDISGACSIGCTIHDAKKLGLVNGVSYNDHKEAAKLLGVPEIVTRLQDHIFEGLPKEDARAWTPRLLRSIREGADYTGLDSRITLRLIEKSLETVIRDDTRVVLETLRALYTRRLNADEPTQDEWGAALNQAAAALNQAAAAWDQDRAARDQTAAAWNQADAAMNQARAARSQAAAARSQAAAAWDQADAAWDQARAARSQAAAAWDQADAAWDDYWRWCADMLCEELQRQRGDQPEEGER